jgi:hypothetical protein
VVCVARCRPVDRSLTAAACGACAWASRPLDPTEPLTFKQFLLREVDDDAQPEEAQARYQAYLEAYYGSKIRADFESKKNVEWWDPAPPPAACHLQHACHGSGPIVVCISGKRPQLSDECTQCRDARA